MSTKGKESEAIRVEGLQHSFQKFKDDHIGIPNTSDAVYYTQAEVDAHNAELTGALNSTDPLTAEEAAAYNAAVTGASKDAGDTLSSAEAAAYNATLEGAVSTSDIKTPAVLKKVKDYVDDGLAGKADLGNDGKVPSSQLPEIDTFPDQTGQSGKFLTTDGSDVSWGSVDLSSKADKLPMTGAGAATENNFMAIDANGNIKDSGKNENSFLTQHQTVTDNNPTLSWGEQSKVGTVGSTDLHVTMPVATEVLTIRLTTNQTSHSDINGASVSVTKTSDGSSIYSGTWAGTDIVVTITAGEEYKIAVGSIVNYSTPSAVTHKAVPYNSRTEVFTYSTEVVTVTCSTEDSGSVTGKKVIINGAEYTLDSTGVVSAKVAYGTSYSVSVGTYVGYITPNAQTFTAGNVSRSVSVVWLELFNGVFIEATDGGLYTASSWTYSGKTPNSVVLLSDSCNIRIAIINSVSKAISSSLFVDYNIGISTAEAAKADYNGRGNTDKILLVESSTDYSAGYCNAYTFPDGTTKGYLGACGEINAIYLNKTNINNCLSACGGSGISGTLESSSCYSDGINRGMCWRLDSNTGYIGDDFSTYAFKVIPIAQYSR